MAPLAENPTMMNPEMHAPHPLDRETFVLPASMPVPGAGQVAINAAVIRARQPVLIDTGLMALRDPFLTALESVIDPADLRWIWVTHADADHVGNLAPVLERAPEARVVTCFLGMAKLAMQGHLLDRVQLMNPGQTLDLGDRELVALRPPVYDAPETMAAFDRRSGTLFSADSFGALLEEIPDEAGAIDGDALRQGLLAWSAVDAPWLADIDRPSFRRALETVRGLGAERVASAHLPPAIGMTETLLGLLAEAPEQPPFVGPDQAAMEQLLAAATGA
ncbi:MAG: MBL fold metallo-hydrolase [Candidatus Eiseniibacteriota bacterium]